MKHFLELVLSKLVAHPQEIDVLEEPGERQTTFQIAMNPEDIGRVIGRNGRTISAIRTILNAAASKTDSRVALEILENP